MLHTIQFSILAGCYRQFRRIWVSFQSPRTLNYIELIWAFIVAAQECITHYLALEEVANSTQPLLLKAISLFRQSAQSGIFSLRQL